MRLSISITILFCISSICASGQIPVSDHNEREYKLIIIHKQFGDTITESDLYQYMGMEFSLYTFKISGDTIFKYLDEDPELVSHASIDSLSNGTLGRPANLDSITDIDGNVYCKRELENNILVLNFWATWCSPCIAELPELNKLVDNYSDKDVLFFAPTLENGQILEAFLSNREFRYTIVPGATEITESIKTYALPTHVLIDQKGTVQFIQVGADSQTIYEVLSNEIDKFLQSDISF